jgi:hypothetical protein
MLAGSGSHDEKDRGARVMLRSPIFHTGLVVSLIIVVTLAAAVALTVANFSRALSDVVETRFEFLAADLRESVETGLNLGLALDELENVEGILVDRLGRDEAIRELAVENADGAVAEIALPLENAFGQEVGTLRLTYATGAYRSTVAEVEEQLVRRSAILAGIACTGAALGCALVLSGIPRSLRRARQRLAGEAEGPPSGEIEQSAHASHATTAEVIRELDALDREIAAADPQGGGRCRA